VGETTDKGTLETGNLYLKSKQVYFISFTLSLRKHLPQHIAQYLVLYSLQINLLLHFKIIGH